ncbi:MAG TPA: hypothetical protein VH083_20670 [Myxococcales bacterium]|nr:hypothetical protein [Myxococcales bacterium]
MSNLRTISMISLLALASCRARQTGPDANYEKGARIYQQLYATQLDDAYGDPKMNQVVVLLKQVDPRSVDAESAKRMLASIDSGRVVLQKQQAARDKMAAAAAASLARPLPQLEQQRIMAAAEPPDAGAPPVDPFGAGASVAEINLTSGGCLTPGEPFREKETNVTGTVYRVGRGTCADRLPGLIGQAVLVGKDGRIYRRLQDPTLTRTAAPAAPGAGPIAPPPAAAPAQAAAPNPPAQPATPAAAVAPGDEAADAGYQMYIPGMPIPEGMNPSPPPPPPDQQQ